MFYMKHKGLYTLRPVPWIACLAGVSLSFKKSDPEHQLMLENDKTHDKKFKRKLCDYMQDFFYYRASRDIARSVMMAEETIRLRNEHIMKQYWE